MRKKTEILILGLLILCSLVTGCDFIKQVIPGGGAQESNVTPQAAKPAATVSAPNSPTTAGRLSPTVTNIPISPTANSQPSPTVPLPIVLETYDELPQITVSSETELSLASSNENGTFPGVSLRPGDSTYLLGQDKNGAWLLVMYRGTLGWIPSILSGFETSTQNLVTVPETRLNPCKTFLGVTSRAGADWESPNAGVILVEGYLYRSVKEKNKDITVSFINRNASKTVLANISRTALEKGGEILYFSSQLDAVQKGARIALEVKGTASAPVQASFYSNSCSGGPKIAQSTLTPNAGNYAATTHPTPTPTDIIITSVPIWMWSTEAIISGSKTIAFVSLIIDQKDIPHIVYFNEKGASDDAPYYSTKPDGKWSSSPVAISPKLINDGFYNSTAVDSSGNINLLRYVYFADANGGNNPKLILSQKNASEWSHSVVREKVLAADSAMTLDMANKAHIIYLDRGLFNLMYIRPDGSQMTIDDARPYETNMKGGSLAIARSKNNVIGVVYLDKNKKLKYRELINGAWVPAAASAVVDNTTSAAFPALTFDQDGNPWISYYDQLNGGLWVARRIGSAWSSKQIDPGKYTGTGTSIVADRQNGIHISYFDTSVPVLKYAYWNRNGENWNRENWSIQTMTSSLVGKERKYSSIALDSKGMPHIAFSNAGSLQYASRTLK
jgi:hypothetical protein